MRHLLQKLANLVVPLAGLIVIDHCDAQSITPDSEHGNTIVNAIGNQYMITGGNSSSDGANQFHSFSQFSLQSQEVATFQANPMLQNIVARVTGGNPSLIDGLIQVTGGNPHLFLLNPSGMIFGANARLNVPGSFTATTANGIGFDNHWLQAIGRNDYDLLTGSPQSFAFTMGQPGAIVNLGQLSVAPHQTLALLGGTVVSSGPLVAPQGQVIVAAIPGSSWVRLSQPNNPLSLEIQPLPPALNASVTPQAINDWTLPIATLPQLLTGGNLNNADRVIVSANGQVELTGSGLALTTGDVSVRSLTADHAIFNADRNVVLFESQLQTAHSLTVIAKDTLRIRDSLSNAFWANAGGDLRLQGNQQIDILALNHLATGIPLQSGGNLTLVSNGIVSGDAHFSSGKNLAILTTSGQAGKFVSLFDPIVYVQGDFDLGSYTGVSLKVQADGNITLGDVTITAPDTILNRQIQGDPVIPFNDPDSNLLSTQTALILRTSRGSISVGDIIAQPNFEGDRGATVILSARENITTGKINTAFDQPVNIGLPVQGGSVTLEAGRNVQVGGAIDTFFLGNNANNVAGGNVSITAGGSMRLLGPINTAATNFFEAAPSQNFTTKGGDVTLRAGAPGTSGHNILFNGQIDASGRAAGLLKRGNGIGGNVQIVAQGLVRGLGGLNGVTIDASGVTGRLSSSAIATPGQVFIQQDGGPQNLDFNIADRGVINNVGANGLAGMITTGVDSVDSISVPVGQTISAGNTISLQGLNRPPSLTITSPLQIFASGQPIRLTYADLAPLKTDIDQDRLSPIRLTQVTSEGQLTLKKANQLALPAAVGAILEPGDELIYRPLPTSRGEIAIATLTITDRVASASVPLTVQLGLSALLPSSCSAVECVNATLARDLPLSRPELNISKPELIPAVKPARLLTEKLLQLEQLRPTAIDLSPSSTILPENTSSREFENYFNLPKTPIKVIGDQQQLILNVERRTKTKPAFIYLNFALTSEQPSDQDRLEILLITGNGTPIRKQIPGATRGQVVALAKQLRNEVSDPLKTNSTAYLKPAQQLYRWLIAPIAADLAIREVDNLVFLADVGLRSLPFAVMHDGHQFLLEKYSLGLMPSVSLTDTSATDLNHNQLLSVGISEEIQDQPALPGVLAEISTLKQNWLGKTLLNQTATLANLKAARQQYPYNVVHIATHAAFPGGDRANAYIQLWDGKLRLNDIRQLNWQNPPVELLVLSACSTAVGDRNAELGFAGMALQTGVKSVAASLWQVNDLATTALISRFYAALKTAPTRSIALQQAQLAMLRAEVYVANGQIKGVAINAGTPGNVPIFGGDDRTFAHPYYWSAFTIVGNPW